MKSYTSSKIILPAQRVKRMAPMNIVENERGFFAHEYERLFQEVRLEKYRHINSSAEGILFKGHSVIKQNKINSLWNDFQCLVKNYLLKKKIVLNQSESYLLVTDQWSQGYFHWMCDVLPKLLLIEHLLKECILLIPETLLKFHVVNQTLKIFDMKGVQSMSSGSYVQIPNLLVPGYAAPTGNYNEEIMRRIRKRYTDFYKHTETNLGERIYVSRSRMKKRRIANESEVIPLLESFGFNTIFFEDYTFEQQVSISKNAKILVGAHGAGLTNALFMNPQSSLLEIRQHKDRTNLCYFSLASALDINYYYLFGDPIKNNPLNKEDSSGELLVNTDKMRNLLQQLNLK